jgi:hypothetical protein
MNNTYIIEQASCVKDTPVEMTLLHYCLLYGYLGSYIVLKILDGYLMRH